MVIPFRRFGKLSAMILLKIISVILAWNSSSMPMNHGFDFFIVFHRRWMFFSYLTINFSFIAQMFQFLYLSLILGVLSSLWSTFSRWGNPQSFYLSQETFHFQYYSLILSSVYLCIYWNPLSYLALSSSFCSIVWTLLEFIQEFMCPWFLWI